VCCVVVFGQSHFGQARFFPPNLATFTRLLPQPLIMSFMYIYKSLRVIIITLLLILQLIYIYIGRNNIPLFEPI
jgi:hypothetical protein